MKTSTRLALVLLLVGVAVVAVSVQAAFVVAPPTITPTAWVPPRIATATPPPTPTGGWFEQMYPVTPTQP
ncbi:MAG: hypothetical protein HYZ49_05750 [Chloroflexi bacterium]|nr:hypothetical protein [Chloroflexota bacterium]